MYSATIRGDDLFPLLFADEHHGNYDNDTKHKGKSVQLIKQERLMNLHHAVYFSAKAFSGSSEFVH